MKKGVQHFSKKYLEQTKGMTPDQVCDFLESYRLAVLGKESPSILISLRVPGNVLAAFKTQARLEDKKYQAQIVTLMRRWLEEQK